MSKRCGYCRDFGHMKPKCDDRLTIINNVMEHHYGERAAIHNLLMEKGFGIGAIVKFEGYDEDPYVVISHSPLTTSVLVEYRPVKYSKAVRTNLLSMTQRKYSEKYESRVEIMSRSRVTILVSPLSDMSRTMHFTVNGKNLGMQNDRFSYAMTTEILVPSDDTDIDLGDLRKQPIRLHERLMIPADEKDPRFTVW